MADGSQTINLIRHLLSASLGLFSAWLTRLPQPFFGYSLLALSYDLCELTLAHNCNTEKG
jgi:hypothetical protein